MKIDIREVLELQRRRAEINAIDVASCEFYDGDKKIEVSEADADEWRFIGLSTVTFVEEVLQHRIAGSASEVRHD